MPASRSFREPTAGSTISTRQKKLPQKSGIPVIVKASAGGGGIGMQIVRDEKALEEAITASMRIAQSAFGDATVFIEKYLVKPRHIEFQVLADEHGHAVHLFERECSIQRRHQKLIEEAPSPIMTHELRAPDVCIGPQSGRGVGLYQCRIGRVPVQQRELLFHGDEYPAPG